MSWAKLLAANRVTALAPSKAELDFATLSAYFEGCRMKRNGCEHDFAGGVSDTVPTDC